MAVSKAKRKRREIKERRYQPDAQDQLPDTPAPAPGIHGTDTPPASAARHGRTTDGATTPPPPTPGDRMRQRAVDQRKEQLARSRVGTASQGEAPASPHYGGPRPAPGPATTTPSTGDRSIYLSIHQRTSQALHAAERETPGRSHPAQDPASGGTGRPDTGGPRQRPRSRGEEGRRWENC